MGAKMTQQGHAEHGRFGKSTIGIKAPFFDGTQPCAQTDPDLFFPDNSGEANKVKGTIRKICSTCEFKSPCLEYALENNPLGVWGGLLESERRSLKKKKRNLVA